MTSDMGELFNAKRKHSKEKRASNRRYAQEKLQRLEIDHEIKNDGAHIIVRHAGSVVDFWPGTGKWKDRGTGKTARGIRKLFKHLEINDHE